MRLTAQARAGRCPTGGPGLRHRRGHGPCISGRATRVRPRAGRTGRRRSTVVPPSGARDRVRPDCAYIHRDSSATATRNCSGRSTFRSIRAATATPSSPVKRLRPSATDPPRRRTVIDFSGKRPSLVDRRTAAGRVVRLRCSAPSLTSPRRPRPSSCPTGSTRTSAWRRTARRCGSWDRHPPLPLRARRQPHLRRPGRPLRAVVIPARPRKPRDKARRENCVLIAQRWILARCAGRPSAELGPLTPRSASCSTASDRPMEAERQPPRSERSTARLHAAAGPLTSSGSGSVNIDSLSSHVYSVPTSAEGPRPRRSRSVRPRTGAARPSTVANAAQRPPAHAECGRRAEGSAGTRRTDDRTRRRSQAVRTQRAIAPAGACNGAASRNIRLRGPRGHSGRYRPQEHPQRRQDHLPLEPRERDADARQYPGADYSPQPPPRRTI